MISSAASGMVPAELAVTGPCGLPDCRPGHRQHPLRPRLRGRADRGDLGVSVKLVICMTLASMATKKLAPASACWGDQRDQPNGSSRQHLQLACARPGCGSSKSFQSVHQNTWREGSLKGSGL
jgi:hypothetical protein